MSSDDESKSESILEESEEVEESGDLEETGESESEEMPYSSRYSPSTSSPAKTIDVSKLGSAAGRGNNDDDEFDF